jgi:protein ImuB
VAALRIDDKVSVTLQRLGLRSIGDLAQAARAPLNRRFGPTLLQRLDQALGAQPEAISPHVAPPHYGVRLTLPEPIGLLSDVMAATERLLVQL